MLSEYTNITNAPVRETVCEKREPIRETIPLIVDENNKILCECEAMVSRITEIIKGEALPFSETEDVRCLMDAVNRNRATIYRVTKALKSVLDVLEP